MKFLSFNETMRKLLFILCCLSVILSSDFALGEEYQGFFDKEGRLIRDIRPDMEVTYFYAGNATNPKTSKPVQRVERWRDGSLHDLHYDNFGLLAESVVTDKNGAIIRRWYDKFGDVIRTIKPDGSEEVIEYFRRGLPKQIRFAGHVHDFDYNASGILLVRYLDGQVTWRRVVEPLSKIAYGVNFTPEGQVHAITALEKFRVLTDKEVETLLPLIADSLNLPHAPTQP